MTTEQIISDISYLKYLTFLIALIGVLIAGFQYRLNRYKIKLDLFEKRYKVYNSYREAIANIMRNGNIVEEESIRFLRETKEAQFLFGRDINNLFNDVYKKFCELQLCETMLQAHNTSQEERKSYAQKSSEIKKWINQLYKIDIDIFKNYIDFSKL